MIAVSLSTNANKCLGRKGWPSSMLLPPRSNSDFMGLFCLLKRMSILLKLKPVQAILR